MSEDTSPNPWPTGDATPERFNLTINEDRTVTLFDGETRLRFGGPDALADALQYRMRLVELAETGLEEMTPAKFLAETLPKLARRQRLESMLAEVRAAESAALAELTDVIALLNRAISLRERLEKALETAVRPLSATESAEQTSVKGLVTPASFVWQKAALRLIEYGDFNSAGIEPNWSRSWAESETVSRIGTYKPQPY